jgi:hypothetical protein
MIIGRPIKDIRARAKMIRADLRRRYDVKILRQELYEKQRGLCFLCDKPLQSSDGALCSIEHAIPAFLYAEFDWTIKKACAQANNRKNLFAAHRGCNTLKRNRDYSEWVAEGGKVRLRAVPNLAEEVITRIRTQMAATARRGGLSNKRNGTGFFKLTKEERQANGRKYGPAGGRAAKEKGTGIFAPGAHALYGSRGGAKNKENGQALALGKMYGPINGRKAVESGQIQKLGKLLGPINGRRSKELGKGVFGMTQEQRQAASRKAGRKCKERGTGIFAPEHRGKGGRTNRERSTGIFSPGMQAKGGSISGRRHKENDTGIFGLTHEQRSANGRKSGGMNRGRKHSEEALIKMRAAAQHRSPEHQEKINAHSKSLEKRALLSASKRLYWERRFIKSVAWG